MVADEREDIVSRATIRPLSSTAGCFSSAPTVRIAACGGLIIAVKWSIPYMPRFETVNVPPDSSGGVIFLSRTFSSARASRAIWPSDFLSASKTSAPRARPAPRPRPHVHARVELELAVAVGAVHARVLAQRDGARPSRPCR